MLFVARICAQGERKFLVELFTKSSQIPKAEPLVARRNERKSRVELVQLSSSGAFLRARGLFAREKVLENRLQVECDLKNYPVDDF